MAELLREQQRSDSFAVPDWTAEFMDEKAFAEDFSRLVVERAPLHEPFWDNFLPSYAAEFNRVFLLRQVGGVSPA